MELKKNMSNKRILLFVMTIFFLIISVSAISAADASGDDMASSSDILQNAVDNSMDTQTIVKEESNVKTASESSSVENDVAANKEIVKTEQNIKTAPKTIVVNQNNIETYFSFDEDTMGLKDTVSAGDVLDFQGTINKSGKIILINKPVNITASKGNALIFLNTTAQSMFGDEDLPCFQINKAGSYTNVTGLKFFNTQFYIKNAHHIKVNNITTNVTKQKVGSGVGQTSIRDNSSYITVENSTFTTEDNGGSSTFVLAWASYCTIRNNYIRGIGNVGNLLYLTTYNVEGVGSGGEVDNTETANCFNVIDNNTLVGPSTPASICYGIGICGSNNTVTNNKIYYNGTGITTQWITGEKGQSINTTIKNNELYGCKLYGPEGGVVANNTVHGELVPSATAQIYNNTVDSVRLLSNTVLTDNTINGNVDIAPGTQNVTLANCTVKGNVTVRGGDSTSVIPKNITLENLQIDGCINLTSKDGGVYGFTVKNNNISDGIYFTSKRNNQIRHVVVENNIINSDDEYAVYVNKTVTNVTIKNNRINSTDKNGDDAVYVNAAENDVTVQNNKMPQKQTQIALNSVTSSMYVNESVTITGTFKVEGKASKATELTVYDNNSKIATITSIGDNGVFTYTYKATTSGQHTITFKFAQNDTLFASEASKTITVNNPSTTAITLSGSSSAYYGDNVVVNGTIKAGSVGIKANVDVYEGSSKLATVSSGTDGKFTYTYKAASVGSHNLTFKFAGNVSHVASQASKTITVNPIVTAITVTANPTTVFVTQNVTVTATFKAANSGVKVNTLDVYDNNVKVASVASDNSGKATYTYNAAKSGSHSIAVKFAGNTTHAASEASTSVTVNNPSATTITLSGSSSAYYGDNVVVNGTIKAGSVGIKANVDVYEGSSKLATVSSGTDGKFTYTYKAASVGSHNLTFKFAGNVSHVASQASKTITVNPIVTAITVTANPTTVFVTQNVTVTATFKAANSGVKVNTLDVYDNNVKVASVASDNSGKATYTYNAAKSGSHSIAVKFAGNTTHAASEATTTITVKDPATTSISLSSNRTSLFLTEKANITGTFKAGSAGVKVDSVTVSDNGKQVATVGPSGANGVFNYIFDGTVAGSHNLTFKFAGNVSHKASQASIIINVEEPNATAIELTSNATELFVDETAKIDALFKFEGESTGTYVNKVTITDNDKEIATVGPSDDGKLSYGYMASEIGTHTLKFSFAGNVSHVASESTITIVVKEPDATEITLNSDSESLYVDETAKVDVLFAYAGESEGTYVNSIMVSDNDKFVTIIGPSTDGKLTYEYVATEIGTHELSFLFVGNNTHAQTENTITIVVKEADATEIKLTVDGDTEFNVSESSKINGVFAYAGEEEGTYVDLITIYEDGVQIATVGPTEDGTFDYTYTPQKPGDHKLTFKFAGNNSHAASEASLSYHIRGYVLKVDTTEFITGQTATIQASIYFEDQVSTDINKGKVTFKVNGKTLKDENGKIIYVKIVNGTAKLENYVIPENWTDRNFTIQAISTASSQAPLLRSELETLNVHEEVVPDEPAITTEDVTAKVGSKVTFKATISGTDEVVNEGKIVFKVNGKSLKDENGKVIYAKIVNNEAVLDYVIPDSWKIKNYTISAVLLSSDYPRLVGNATLTLSN